MNSIRNVSRIPNSQTVEKTDDRLIFGQKSLRTTIQTKSCALKILLIISFASAVTDQRII